MSQEPIMAESPARKTLYGYRGLSWGWMHIYIYIYIYIYMLTNPSHDPYTLTLKGVDRGGWILTAGENIDGIRILTKIFKA